MRNNKCSRIYRNIFLFLCLLIINPMPVYAAEAQVTLSVEQKIITSANKQDIIGEYILVRLEAENPMPAGSIDDEYAFSLRGDETKAISSIMYTKAGIYRYQITQIGINKQDASEIDETVYIITVYVGNSVDGGLSTNVIIEHGEYKVDAIRFSNDYRIDANIDEDEIGNTETESISTENPTTTLPNTEDTTGNKNTSHINTGDENAFLALIIALVVAFSVVVLALIIKHKRK